MRAATWVLVVVVAGCAPPVGTMSEQEAAAVTRNIMARADAEDRTSADPNRQRLALLRERQQENRAQLFGLEWRMTRTAMECDDPEIRRVAYATAAQQDRYLAMMARNRPSMADITAREDARAARRLAGYQPTAAECRRLLTMMGESAKAMRDGER